MTNLYGRKWKADELSAYLGRMEQVAGVERFRLEDGKADGVRCARVYTGSGFEFTVVLDRAMDVALSSYRGAALNWLSQVGIAAPEYYEPKGKGWDRTFFGGLVQTCGLRCAGHDSTVDGEEFGLHGRISTTPAENVNVTEEWRGDEYVLALEGEMHQAHAYADNLVMKRSIGTRAGAKSFTLRDEVTNEGAHTSPHVIMYHVNPGFPVVAEDSEVLWSLERVEGTSEEEFLKFAAPAEEAYGGGYFYHRPDSEGVARTAVVNRRLAGGVGMYIAWDHSALPVMVTWKQMARRAYLVAVEPANCRVTTNKKLKERGKLPMLEPGETRTYEIEFGALDGPAEMDEFRRLLP